MRYIGKYYLSLQCQIKLIKKKKMETKKRTEKINPKTVKSNYLKEVSAFSDYYGDSNEFAEQGLITVAIDKKTNELFFGSSGRRGYISEMLELLVEDDFHQSLIIKAIETYLEKKGIKTKF